MSTHPASGFSEVARTSRLSTVDETARFLGVSRWTVYRLVRDGELRAVKVGERFRFRPCDVDEYLERGSP
jgi:excisionase family DNA binding protein